MLRTDLRRPLRLLCRVSRALQEAQIAETQPRRSAMEAANQGQAIPRQAGPTVAPVVRPGTRQRFCLSQRIPYAFATYDRLTRFEVWGRRKSPLIHLAHGNLLQHPTADSECSFTEGPGFSETLPARDCSVYPPTSQPICRSPDYPKPACCSSSYCGKVFPDLQQFQYQLLQASHISPVQAPIGAPS